MATAAESHMMRREGGRDEAKGWGVSLHRQTAVEERGWMGKVQEVNQTELVEFLCRPLDLGDLTPPSTGTKKKSKNRRQRILERRPP